MEQKDYKFEILKILLNKNAHARMIAQMLKINHMTIIRKLNLLEKENVVDYKKEGKNKVYFLKNTFEARNYLIILEKYKLIELIGKYPFLRRVSERISNDKKISLAILFGSYANFSAKKDSDIDIYIETQDNKIKKDLESFDSKISVKIGLYDKSSFLIKEIEKNHIILKGVEKYYEKNEFFI